MTTLYHFPTSPFSRRARLMLAHKKLSFELKDARANDKFRDEARRLWPLRQIPVLSDGDVALGDTTAISHYLDAAYPDSPAIWPADRLARARALEVAKLVDGALDVLVDVGTRYYALRGDEHWGTVSGEMLGRAQDSLDALASRVEATRGSSLVGAGWCAAEIWLYSAVAWLEGLPARASENQNVAQIMTLRWELPAPLAAWAKQHADREDVRGLTA